jgi:hypothetical protein
VEKVPRYGASRSDHRSPDWEPSADDDHPEDVSLLKLARIIGRDEVFLAICRDSASRYASVAQEALGPAPDDDPPEDDQTEDDQTEDDQTEDDQPEFHADDPIIDSRPGRAPQGTSSNPAYPDGDDRGAHRGRAIGTRRSTVNADRSTGAPQLGAALSELARLVGRIDSFLAAGSARAGSQHPDRGELGLKGTAGGRIAAGETVDDVVLDSEAHDIEMPVPSRHDRLTNDTDDPGLSLYAPRRKRRAAFVVARMDQPDSRYGGATRSTGDRSGAAREPARGRGPRQSWLTDHADNYKTRPQRRRRLPIDTATRRHGGTLLTATAVLAFTATAALYGYRTWTDPGSSRPGPIAAVAAPITATGDSFSPPAADAATNPGVGPSARGVWPDLTDLLAPGTTLDGAPSASRLSAGERTVAAPAARPQRRDADRAHRSASTRVGAHAGSISPIGNEAAPASTNVVRPCEVGATRPGC